MRPVGLGPVRHSGDHPTADACRKGKTLTLLGVGRYERFPLFLAQPDLIAPWFVLAPTEGLGFLAAAHSALEIACQAALVNLQDQAAVRWYRNLAVALARVANLDGARFALRLGHVAPALQCLLRIAVAADRPRCVRAQKLAARRHAVDAPTGAREIGHLVRLGKGGLVDPAEEVALCILPSRFDLEVERDRDEVVIDHLEIS